MTNYTFLCGIILGREYVQYASFFGLDELIKDTLKAEPCNVTCGRSGIRYDAVQIFAKGDLANRPLDRKRIPMELLNIPSITVSDIPPRS
jgi:hypothetical protein